MQNTKEISKMIFAAHILILVFIIGLGIITITSVDRLNSIIKNIYIHPYQVSNAGLKMQSIILQIRDNMLEIVLSGDASRIQSLASDIDNFDSAVMENLAVIKQGFLGDMQRVENTIRLMDEWRNMRSRIIELSVGGQKKQSAALAMGQGREIFLNINSEVDHIVDFAQKKAAEFVDEANLESKTRILVVSLVLGGFVTFMGVIWVIMTRSIIAGLKKGEEASQELAKSENKFHILFESAADIILILDMQGQIIEINDVGYTRLGYSKEEMLGKKISEFDAPEFIDKVPERMAELARKGVSRFESAHVHKNGTIMPVEIHARIIELAGQKRVLSVIRDITHSKELENSLSEREAKYRAAIETSADGFWIVDLKGKFLEVNDAYVQRSGYSREELLSMSISDLEAKEKPEETSSHIENIIRDKHARFESYHRTKDGRIWPVEIVTNYWPIADGRLFVFIVDISERKKALEQIALMAKVFQNSVEAMMITDSNNRIVNTNPAFTVLTGYEKYDVYGKDPKILSSGNESPGFYKEMWRCLTHDGSWQGEITDRRKDGSTYPKWLTIATLRNDKDKIINYIASFIDLTGKKQIELELEKRVQERTEELNRTNASLIFANRAKDSFLATMSHEIRTPLGGMLGMLELLNLSALEPGQRETLQTARDSGKSLLRILNDILDWSKIEEGKLALLPQPTSHVQLLKEVVSTYSHVASTAGLSLRYQTDPKLSPMHEVDPLRISEVLNNFVSNALKFTKHGEVVVRDELLEKKDGVERIRFSVSDTGIGIEKEVQEQLFQVYFQAGKERLYGGTGLGLAICRRLADMMQGNIELESTPGQGSVFSIVLALPVVFSVQDSLASPLEENNQFVQAARTAIPVLPAIPANPPLSENFKAGKVLVVDDNPINVTLLVRQVEQLGHYAEGVEDGTSALTLWQQGKFDIVITDCHMPGMDGYSLSNEIRRIESEQGLPRIPIIACTANALSEENELCEKAGMDVVLVKPVNLDMLRSLFSTWIPGELI
jgi:PAS domain S-box-containing protein